MCQIFEVSRHKEYDKNSGLTIWLTFITSLGTSAQWSITNNPIRKSSHSKILINNRTFLVRNSNKKIAQHEFYIIFHFISVNNVYIFLPISALAIFIDFQFKFDDLMTCKVLIKCFRKKNWIYNFLFQGFLLICCKGYFLTRETVMCTSIFVVYFDHNRKLQLCRKRKQRKICEIFSETRKFKIHEICTDMTLVVLSFFDQKFLNWILNFGSVWHPKDWACPRIQVVMSRRGCENLHNQLGNVKNYMLLLNYASYLMVR